MNCETDFVARNEAYGTTCKRIAEAALQLLPVTVAMGDASPTGAPAADGVADLPTLSAATLTSQPSGTVHDAVTGLVSKFGENCIVRRVATFAAPPGGILTVYTHNNVAPGQGTLAVVVALRGGAAELSAEARSQGLEVARKVAMHVAAMRPLYLSKALIPADVMAREKAIVAAEMAKTDKPADIMARVEAGRLAKWYAEHTLEEQPFALADATSAGKSGKAPSVGSLVAAWAKKGGKGAGLAGFAVWRLGDLAAAPAGDSAAAAGAGKA